MRLRLFFLVFLGIYSSQGFAQKRVCDLAVEIIHPTTDYTYHSPGYDSVTIAIINQGPDSLIATDMFMARRSFGGDVIVPSFYTLGKKVLMGERFEHTERFHHSLVGNVDDFRLCMEVYAWSPVSSDSLQHEKSISYTDNIACVYPNHRDSTFVGIQSVKHSQPILVYPNPSSGRVFILGMASMVISIREAQIFDSRGSLLTVKDMNTKEPLKTINLTDLSPGVYHLHLVTNTGIIPKKIVLQ